MTTYNSDIEPSDAIIALNKFGDYPNYSIALDIMQISIDGGKTLIDIWVGFNWKSNKQDVVIACPHKILSGKQVQNSTYEKKSNIKVENNQMKKKWWEFWK